MVMRVQGPDGRPFDFPDGTPETEMADALDRVYSPPGIAEDVAKAGASGALTGAVSTAVGLPGTVAGLTNQAADFLARQTVGRAINAYRAGSLSGALDSGGAVSQPDPGLAPPSIGPEATLPTVQSVAERLPQYTPATTAGQYARSAGEMLGGNMVLPGGSMAARATAGIAGGLGAEAAGQAVQGTTLEPYEGAARLAGALVAPGLAGRIITPLRGDPATAEAAQRLRNEGIDVSAGQAKGSEALKTAESQLGQVPFGKQAAPEQQAQFNAAVSRRMMPEGDPGVPALTGEVMQTRATQLAQQYDDILSKNTMRTDPKFGQDLSQTMGQYLNRISLQQRPEFERAVNSLAEDINRFGGTLPGPMYQQARSWFSDMSFANRLTDPAMAQATRGVRNALDDAMARSIPDAGEAELLKATNRNYRAMKTIEDALSRAGSDGMGNLTPNAVLGAATKSAGKAARARGTDDLLNLAQTAKGVMRTPPNSGTASRLNIMNLAQGGGLTGHFAGIGGIAGAGLGVGAPALLSRIINGRMGQAWLGNSLLNEGVLSGARALVNAAQSQQRGILGGR
jgi:hypothetical protein